MAANKRAAVPASVSSTRASNALIRLSPTRLLPNALELKVLEVLSALDLASLLGISRDVRELVHAYLRIASRLEFTVPEQEWPSCVPLFRRKQLLSACFSFSRRCEIFVFSHNWFEQQKWQCPRGFSKAVLVTFLAANSSNLQVLSIDSKANIPFADELYPLLACCRKLRTLRLQWSEHATATELNGLATVLGACKRLEEVRAGDFEFNGLPVSVGSALLASGQLYFGCFASSITADRAQIEAHAAAQPSSRAVAAPRKALLSQA